MTDTFLRSESATEFVTGEAAIERAVFQILAAIGEEPDRQGLRSTPARVARMYSELLSG